jgi:hypothetical protein
MVKEKMSAGNYEALKEKYPTLTVHKDDCFTIENFITPDEATKIIAYLEHLVDSGKLQWNQISFYDSFAMGFWDSDKNLEQFGLPEDYFPRLKFKIKKAGEALFGIKWDEISYHAQKWIPGAFADFHSDNTDHEGNPTAFERSRYAAFMYLNEDFTGGLLNYRDFDITITPKVGLIAIFAGGFGNEHEVTTVKDGTRYTIGSFWDDASIVYTDEQRQRWADELAETRKEQDEQYKQWAVDKETGHTPIYKGKGE